MSTKLHITQQYVYKTANNIHVNKTCLKKAKKCTRIALQHKSNYNTHKGSITEPNQPKGNTMFEFEKQYKNYEQAVGRVIEMYEFWFNAMTSAAKTYLTPKTK
jgi:hypothetical protein